jgi:hypothetical protein
MIKMAEDYRHYAQKKSNAHYKMCELASGKHSRLGVPAVIASTLVGTAIFATLNSPQQSLWLQIIAGLLSLLAAVLVALQTFFNYSDVASKHRDAAASYEAIRHKLDWFILAHASLVDATDLEKPLAMLLEISASMDDVRRVAPSIPDSVYDAAQTRVATRPVLGAR